MVLKTSSEQWVCCSPTYHALRDSCSDVEASSEQGEVAGLSSFMAKALKVVSVSDAFLQKEQGPRSVALPSFSFNKRGALVKTMSRKHSIGSQQSTTGSMLLTHFMPQLHVQYVPAS